MKIGVMSDSHDNLPMIRRALELFREAGAKCLIHAGDIVAPFAVREILKFDGPAYGCFGNNDGERNGIRDLWPEICDPPHRLTLSGRRILLMHDPIPLKESQEILRDVDVVITGHTHKALVEKRPDGCLHLNPGETGGWLTGKATVAILDTDTLEARILELSPSK